MYKAKKPLRMVMHLVSNSITVLSCTMLRTELRSEYMLGKGYSSSTKNP